MTDNNLNDYYNIEVTKFRHDFVHDVSIIKFVIFYQ